MVYMSENNRYFMNKNELLANAEKALRKSSSAYIISRSTTI